MSCFVSCVSPVKRIKQFTKQEPTHTHTGGKCMEKLGFAMA